MFINHKRISSFGKWMKQFLYYSLRTTTTTFIVLKWRAVVGITFAVKSMNEHFVNVNICFPIYIK